MHPKLCGRSIRQPDGSRGISGELRGRGGLGCEKSGKPGFIRLHGSESTAGLLGQSRGETCIEPRNGHVTLIAAFMRRERIDSHADEAAFGTHRGEEGLVRRPHAGKAAFFDRHAFLRARIAHHRHGKRSIRNTVGLDGAAFLICSQQGHTAAQPRGGDAFRVHEHDAAAPVAATAMSPESPWHLVELWMSALSTEIGQRTLKGCVAAIAWIAPHLAFRFVRLLVAWSQQGAVV
ncbi:MAG: hypothetical protein ACK55Z_14150, partial [bacterium]